jgi:hypothetical protein
MDTIEKNPKGAETPSSSPKEKVNQVAPRQTLVVGVISGVSGVVKRANEFRFIHIAGQAKDILVAENVYQNNKELLKLGNSVELTVEEREAGVTGYTDSVKSNKTFGQWVTHSASGLSFVKGVYSSEVAQRLSDEATRASARTSLFSEATGKMADLLGKADGKDKVALATALQGSIRMEI